MINTRQLLIAICHYCKRNFRILFYKTTHFIANPWCKYIIYNDIYDLLHLLMDYLLLGCFCP